jgi:AcrR family transcriptional regulator
VKIPSTVRDPKILAQRRDELVEVATTLFLERGFHKTSIRDIARACPFNLAALYTYVSSKEDILYLVAQHLVNEITKALNPAALTHLDPVEALKLAFETYCGIVSRFSRHIRLLYREIEALPKDAREPILESVQSLTAIFEELLERAVERGEVRDVEPRLAALDLLVAAHMWALHGRLLRSKLDLASFTRQQTEVLFAGLMAAPASAGLRLATPLPRRQGVRKRPNRGAARPGGRRTPG